MEKLSERLREYAALANRLTASIRDHSDYYNGQDKAFEQAADLSEAYEAENEKRIQELDQQVGQLEHEYDQQLELSELRLRCIRDLQSQLAWTPVADGYSLPSEYGSTYEFLSHALNIHVFTCEGDGKWTMAGLDDIYFESELRRGYKSYRRITLPEVPV